MAAHKSANTPRHCLSAQHNLELYLHGCSSAQLCQFGGADCRMACGRLPSHTAFACQAPGAFLTVALCCLCSLCSAILVRHRTTGKKCVIKQIKVPCPVVCVPRTRESMLSQVPIYLELFYTAYCAASHCVGCVPLRCIGTPDCFGRASPCSQPLCAVLDFGHECRGERGGQIRGPDIELLGSPQHHQAHG